MIRVAVADDHPHAQAGIRRLLTRMPEVGSIVAAPTADAEIDVVLLALYGEDRRPALAEIEGWTPRARVLVTAAAGDPSDVVEALQAGASGYLPRNTTPDEFRHAVLQVASGGFALGQGLALVLRGQLASATSTLCLRPALSPRETEALRLISKGCTHPEAAKAMNIEELSVDQLVVRIQVKLGFGNPRDLRRVTEDLGLQRL
ncbi:response regulator transcription factor [Herbidospora yilanensis]|uniref:response regulator transcription factor n=1 Tax=Herbidospora yilanensis TaxID=354426 RepID=UPI0007811164|nr:response regulator transcription factor [Herbidospora yilanensis]